MIRVIALLAVLVVPAAAAAQSAPNAFLPTHQVLPWGLRTPIAYGNFVKDVWVPPYTVVLDTILPVPTEPSQAASATAGTAALATTTTVEPQYAVWRQSVVVPGYWIRQTTAGDFYPQRWMLEQVSPGNYRWRLLGPEMRLR